MANPSWFNQTYYLTSKLEQLQANGETAYTNVLQVQTAIEAAGMTVYEHFSKFSLEEGTSPNQYFNTNEYLAAKAAQAGMSVPELMLAFDAAGFTNAYDHFARHGWLEGVNPSNAFDVSDYLAAKAVESGLTVEAVTAAFVAGGFDPISHYVEYGEDEGVVVTPVPADEQVDDETVDGGTDGAFTLTDGIDTLVGGIADNIFNAPIVQNQNGELVNTLETGDTLYGGQGNDTLNVDLIDSQSTNLFGAPAISATTNGIEVVTLRAQYIDVDVAVNWSNLDAELMSGVEQYWDVNSRASVQIEDIRQLPEELTFGMRQTDPIFNSLATQADFLVYFDPAQVADDRGSDIDSSLMLTLIDNGNPTSELEFFPVSGVAFTLDGDSYTVESAAIGEATTYEEKAAAIAAELEAMVAAGDVALDGVTVSFDAAAHTITLVDANGGAFGEGGYTWVDDTVPSGGNLLWDQTVGDPVFSEEPITTNVILDAVGRTSQGGSLDIGSMADGGIEQFNVSVDRSSWLTNMDSNSYFGNGPGHLEIVNLTSIGANGDITLGTKAGFLDDRAWTGGLTDVREVNNEGFVGDMNIAIHLTDNSIGRYLDSATDTVLFNYEGGAGNDNFSIIDESTDGILSDDADFSMNVQMGAGDDRLNIWVPTVNQVIVDGGEGENVISVQDSHGTDDANTFEGFANFQTYEVEGFNWTEHDFTSMPGVATVNIATFGGASTDLIDLAVDTEVTITGKNQTLGNGSNNDQSFGDIEFIGADDDVLNITLENTARIDGELYVEAIDIYDEDTDNISEVRTVNLVSGGERSTSNLVNWFWAERATDLNLTGTQDLAINVSTMAVLPVASGDTPALTIDASDLTGDLVLAVDASNLDNSDDDVITGTAGENDLLALYVAPGDIDTTISGFETIQFGWTTGSDLGGLFGDNIDYTGAGGTNAIDFDFNPITFDAGNTTDVDTFVVALRGAGNWLTLDNLADGVNVVYGDETGANISLNSAPNTLNAEDGGVLNLTMTDVLGDGSFTNINGFDTVNVAVASMVDAVFLDDDRSFSLDLGVDVTEVVFTGGDEDGSLGVGPIRASVTDIDFSGMLGSVSSSLDNALDADAGPGEFVNAANNTNTTIVLNNEGDFTFDELAIVGNTVTTYEFTADVTDDEFDATIFGFQAFNAVGGSLSNVSILDLSALGVEGLSDVVITQGMGFTDITSNEGLDFQIHLTGVVASELANENFSFA